MKAYILTLGCKVNQYESQAMLEELCRSGFAPAETEEEADVVILNSCTVTAASDQKMRKLLHRARRKNPQALLVLTGCMPQAFRRKPPSCRNQIWFWERPIERSWCRLF